MWIGQMGGPIICVSLTSLDKVIGLSDHFAMEPTILKETTYFHDPSLQLKVMKRDPEIAYRLHGHELVIMQSGRSITFTP